MNVTNYLDTESEFYNGNFFLYLPTTTRVIFVIIHDYDWSDYKNGWLKNTLHTRHLWHVPWYLCILYRCTIRDRSNLMVIIFWLLTGTQWTLIWRVYHIHVTPVRNCVSRERSYYMSMWPSPSRLHSRRTTNYYIDSCYSWYWYRYWTIS